ncbi:TOMM system kinase/cyclase fusion protein [Desulfogranum japonicum]|uniref:TOMM system kinase/cyclase fusion protein n=1 Tax=Desulfogranum japonicum TaxID=231447 RepID=UPI00040E7CDB|nr:TOMM system kinase/cyclase fusion protein [Desulfogranum japonicum]
MNSPAPVPGYQVVEFIGEGSFGAVYRAIQESTGQIVAIKLLRLDNLDSTTRERRSARFKRETILCAQLQHPYIVHLIDRGVSTDSTPFAVFEYVSGNTLQELLKMNGPLPMHQLKAVMGQVLEALAFAHKKGIIHRDLKPENIIITSDNIQTHAKVVDFGIGGLVTSARGDDYKSLTLTPDTIGTPSYAAPEQLRGEPPNPKSDLYAWGLIFLECLTGHPVMAGNSVAEIFHKQLSAGEIPFPSAIAAHPVANLLRKALAKKLPERTTSAAHLLTQYHKIHLDNLVGHLLPKAVEDNRVSEATQVSSVIGAGPDKRQLTIVCCAITLDTDPNTLLTGNALDNMQQIQISHSVDIAARYGGFHAGSLGDYVMFYFGYPESSDNDARLAARTILDLVNDSRHRTVTLSKQQGLKIKLRASIHSGPVYVEPGVPPCGNTVSVAFRLATSAKAGEVLVTEQARQRLEGRVHCKSMARKYREWPAELSIYTLLEERQREARSIFSETVFFGRNNETNAIRQIWNKQMGGILIHGEAGIGKTALIEKFLAEIQENTTIIEMQCLPEHRNCALHPILERVRRQLDLPKLQTNPYAASKRAENALKASGCDLTTILPVFCAWFSLPLPANYTLTQHSPERQKKFLFKGLHRLLCESNAPRSCFVIEDLHWSDPTTLEFLNYLSKSNKAKKFLILATTRPDFDYKNQEIFPHTIALEKLNDLESTELIEHIFAQQELSSHLKRQLLNRAGGIPLFIEELSRTFLNTINSPSKEVNNTASWTAKIPETLIELLQAQIMGLGPARETAQLCSVIGREFDYRILQKVSILDEELLANDLTRLIEARVLILKRGIDSATYFFRHALLKDAAYATLSESTRQDIHEQIAKTLEERFPSLVLQQPDNIAQHFASAHNFHKAVQYGTEAAATYLRLANNMEAIEISNKVLTWIDKSGQEKRAEETLQINGILTQALMGTRGWANPLVKQRIDLSHSLLNDAKDSQHYAPALWSLMTYHYVASNRRELSRLVSELVAHAEKTGDLNLLIAANTFTGLSNHGAGRYLQAEKAFELVNQLYDSEKHSDHGTRFGLDTRVWSLATLALVKWFICKPDEARFYADEAITFARKTAHIPSLSIALLYCANLAHYMGDTTLAADVITELNALANQYGLAGYQAYGQIFVCWLSSRDKEAETILNTLQTMGCTAALSYYLSLLAEIYANQKRYKDALHCIEHCLSLCHENDEFFYKPELLRLRGDYLALQENSNLEDMTASYTRALTTAESSSMTYTAKIVHKKLNSIQIRKQKQTVVTQHVT